MSSTETPSVLSRPDTSPVGSSTPIEPVSVAALGEDPRRRHRDHVAGGGGDPVHHRDHRLLRGDQRDRVVQRLAAGDAAARAVDLDDQRLDPRVVGQLGDLVVELAVLGDDPAHRQPRDMRADQRPRLAVPHHQHRADQHQHRRGCATRPAAASAGAGRAEGRFLTTCDQWSAVSDQWSGESGSVEPTIGRLLRRPLTTDHRPLTTDRITRRPGPAGCGGGWRRRGCRPARRRSWTSRTRPSPASPPRPPCP